jgi:phosphopantetheine--protein transferase-like protein
VSSTELSKNLFTEAELDLNSSELAGNFALKEAIFKSLPEQKHFRFQNCGIMRDFVGKPYVKFNGDLQKTMNLYNFQLSATDSREWKIAVAICLAKLE